MVRRRLLVMLFVVAGLCLATPSAALAWGSGGGRAAGPGTHQWILAKANAFARQQGTVWVDMSVAASATLEPDSDPANSTDHDYDRWGMPFGTANLRVATLYNQAVAQYRSGDRSAASRSVGLLAHYYADICDPLHTDDSAAEHAMSGRFESSVDWLLAGPVDASWATYDGYQRVTDPAAATVSAATNAHASYSALVSAYTAEGFDSRVSAIAKAGVNRAANGVADMIMSIQQAAVEVSSSPNVSAHQGVASGGGYYYIFYTGSITRFDQSWNATGTIDQPVGWWTGFIEPHLGDGCYYNGKLYVVAENYPAVTFQQIIVYDAVTMRYITKFWTHQPHEVSSVTVADVNDGNGPVLVVSSYFDSTQLFKYRIADGTYLGTIPLHPAPPAGIQGVAFRDGVLYLNVCPGFKIGKLYSATTDGTTKLLYVRPTLAYHEGLDYDGENLLWLVDRVTDSHVYSLKLPSFLSSLP
ncbi:MAG: hypothetical protein P4L93_12250 [Coriobacteriia bacterium]|nr:hypothetical protein [Coriobacteriia bacterium]